MTETDTPRTETMTARELLNEWRYGSISQQAAYKSIVDTGTGTVTPCLLLAEIFAEAYAASWKQRAEQLQRELDDEYNADAQTQETFGKIEDENESLRALLEAADKVIEEVREDSRSQPLVTLDALAFYDKLKGGKQ